MANLLPTIALFGMFAFFMIYLPVRRRTRRALGILEASSSELNKLRSEVLVVSSGGIPGKEIRKVLGHVSGTSRIEASTPQEADAAEKQAMLSLMKNALEMGANAVMDAKQSSSTYERQGSKWMVSKTYYTGTAVVIATDHAE